MFTFVRAAKAHSELGELEAFDAATAIEEHLAVWTGSCGDAAWRTTFAQSDDPKAEFIDTWTKIKWPHAQLARALQEAQRLPLKPTRAYSPGYARFISVVGHLQQIVDGPILVPCRKFAELLGCEAMSVSRYRRFAEIEGLLKIERRGNKLRREADELVFATEKFNFTTGNQFDGVECYTDTQDSQEMKRIKESQENQEKKEIQDNEREARRKSASRDKQSVAYIPTTAELQESLARTKEQRRCQFSAK